MRGARLRHALLLSIAAAVFLRQSVMTCARSSLLATAGDDAAAAAPAGTPPRCPPVSKELLAARARNNTVMFAAVRAEAASHGVCTAAAAAAVAMSILRRESPPADYPSLAPVHAPCSSTARSWISAGTGCTTSKQQASSITLWRRQTQRRRRRWPPPASRALSGLMSRLRSWVSQPAEVSQTRWPGCPGLVVTGTLWPAPECAHRPAAAGMAWGEEGWRRITWSRVFVLDAIVDYGFNLVSWRRPKD